MSVRTRVNKNEKVEFKYIDENGRPVSSLNNNTNNASQNELYLKH